MTEQQHHTVREFDFEQPDIRKRHFETFDEVQGTGPIYSTTPGYWMFTEMDDIHEVFQHPNLFTNQVMSAMKKDRERRVPYKFVPTQLDPPEHNKYRRILNPMLSPQQIQRRVPWLREVATERALELADREQIDFVSEFARPYVAYVFFDMLGLPQEGASDFAELATQLIAPVPGDAGTERVQEAFELLNNLLAGFIDERRRNPSDDMLSSLVYATVDGEPISDTRLAELALQLFVAGLDTTVAAMSFLIRHLAADPASQAALRADLSLVPHAVEESLRVYSQITPSRKVAEDTEFRGCPMKAGDYIVLPLACANRDGEVFPDATEFDLHREGNRHIAFGAGIHRCVGSHLARAELQVVASVWHEVMPPYVTAPGASHEDYVSGVSGPVRVDIAFQRDSAGG